MAILGSTYRTMLTEAQLMASSPDTVFEWLKNTPQTTWERRVLCVDHAQLAMSLLTRKEPLIALAIAQFSCSSRAVELAFKEGECAELRVIRLAALANTRCSSGWVESTFANGAEGCAAWLATASQLELEALFTNPGVGDRLITSVLTAADPYSNIPEDQLRVIVAALAVNSRMHVQPQHYHLDDENVIDAAWNLSARVPITLEWASPLCRFLQVLPAEWSAPDETKLAVAKRWCEASASLKQDNRRLNEYEEVAYLVARTRTTKHSLVKGNERAVRCATYSISNKPAEILEECSRVDGYLGLVYIMRNKWLWSTCETRALLEATVDEHYYRKGNEFSQLGQEFRWARTSMMKDYPALFDEPQAAKQETDLEARVGTLAADIVALRKTIETRYGWLEAVIGVLVGLLFFWHR